jgi:hypothetical protein
MGMQRISPTRIKAIYTELEKSSIEYLAAKQKFEASRVEFAAAQERFTGIRRLASEMLTTRDWWMWVAKHPSIQYVGMTIGDAILRVLENRAYESAFKHAQNPQNVFLPVMTMNQLVETLEVGGFEFQTTTPLREVNAALINLKGVTKTPRGPKISDADRILEQALSVQEEE